MSRPSSSAFAETRWPTNQSTNRFSTKLMTKTKPSSVAHADQLRHELAGIAVEQAGDVAGHAVPGAAVVALAVGEQADRDDAPDAVGAVHRDRADRIVDLQHALDELAPRGRPARRRSGR